MPKITVETPVIPRHWYEDDKRSKGQHLSEIISRVALDTGKLKAEYGDEEFEFTWQMAFGMAWEDWYLPRLGITHQPGELYADGIAMSPDGVVIKGKTAVLHECKTTKKTLHGPGGMFDPLPSIENQWMWFTQIKGYMHGYRLKGYKCNTAVLHVLFINGNYKFGHENGGFQLRRFNLEFTDQEIRDNWKMILTNK